MWYMRRLDLCNINFFPRIPAEETGLRGEPLNRPKPPGHTMCSGNPAIMSSVVQRGPSFGWLAWSINSSVGGVSGWFSSSDKYSCHRALHSGSDVKVLPALSLIRVEKLRLPDRRRDAHYFNEQTTRNKFDIVFNIKPTTKRCIRPLSPLTIDTVSLPISRFAFGGRYCIEFPTSQK